MNTEKKESQTYPNCLAWIIPGLTTTLVYELICTVKYYFHDGFQKSINIVFWLST